MCVQVVMQYAGAQIIWCQEEPKNMGAWRYVKPRFDTAMRELEAQEGANAPRRIRYVGRPAAASPGTAAMCCLRNRKLAAHSECIHQGSRMYAAHFECPVYTKAHTCTLGLLLLACC